MIIGDGRARYIHGANKPPYIILIGNLRKYTMFHLRNFVNNGGKSKSIIYFDNFALNCAMFSGQSTDVLAELNQENSKIEKELHLVSSVP